MASPEITVNKLQADPRLKDLLDQFKKDIMLSLNCHAVATIQSFDAATLSVSAKINYKKTFFEYNPQTRVYDRVAKDYPIILDAPVLLPFGGDAALTMPIAAGDTCLILFNDRDLNNWLDSGQVTEVSMSRYHSFADAIAFVGIRAFNNPIADYDETRAVLRNGEAQVGVGPSLVKIANATTTLKTLLQALITQINAIVTTNCVPGAPVTISPASQTALTAVSTQIAGLLE